MAIPKISSSHNVRQVFGNFLRYLEDLLKIDPENVRGWKKNDSSKWIGEANLSHLYSLDYPDGHTKLIDKIKWEKSCRKQNQGVCMLHNCRVLMLAIRQNNESLNDYRRIAIIFFYFYRLNALPAQHILPYYLLHGEWKQFCKHYRNREYVSGNIAVLGNYVSDYCNYYHFWVDTISDIWYLRQNIATSEMPQRYLMSYCGVEWQKQILEICGIDPDQVIPFTEYTYFCVENLAVPVRDKGPIVIPAWQANAIRIMAGWQNSDKPSSRFLYVSRADANKRCIVNEPEIHEQLLRSGFEIITLEGMHVKDQQILFGEAKAIIAPHGAGLTNIVWCNPGTVLVELLSEQHLLPCFKELAKQREMIYFPIKCKTTGEGRKGLEENVVISSKQIKDALNFIESVF
ncbi:glycosyltransferase family 61 protein [Halomonas sp. MA07-2]|uniref:glycosyltransferase family 61 protein n=1 Tax=Halomonas sp. MA07-2 TaxID=3440841 RepID=UPI003EEB5B06